MASIMQILRRIGGVKSPPTSGSAGQLALWKAGAAPTDAASLYAHDGAQWKEILDTSAQWTASGADVYRAAGKVGVGVSTPGSTLDVEGGGWFTGGLAVFKNTSVAGRTTGQYAALVASVAGVVDLYSSGGTNPTPPDITISTGTTERVRVVGVDGKVGIGVTNPGNKLDVEGAAWFTGSFGAFKNTAAAGRTTGQYAAFGCNVLGEVSMYASVGSAPGAPKMSWIFKADSVEQLRLTGYTGQMISLPTYTVIGGGSQVMVDSAGIFSRSSSSLKYKKDVEALDPALTDRAIANLRPVWYRTKKAVGDDKEHWSHIGLIAEEVDQVEPRLVNYKTKEVTFVDKPVLDDDGQPVVGIDGNPEVHSERIVTDIEHPVPEDVDYARLSVLLLDYVQRLEKRVAALEARK